MAFQISAATDTKREYPRNAQSAAARIRMRQMRKGVEANLSVNSEYGVSFPIMSTKKVYFICCVK